MAEKYLDINGVRAVFKVVDKYLTFTRCELMGEIKKSMGNTYTKDEVDSKIEDLLDKINEGIVDLSNYYTKTEINSMMPESLDKEHVDEAYEASKI